MTTLFREHLSCKIAGIVAPERIGTVLGRRDPDTLELLVCEELSDSREVHVYDTSLYDLAILEGHDFVLDLDTRKADVFVDKRYKIAVRKVSPARERKTFETHNRCVLGFSLQSPSFKGAKLEAIVKWIDRRFRECDVLMGDCIHHYYTLMMNLGLDESTARREAYRLAHGVAEKDPFAIAAKCRFRIVFESDIRRDPNYLPTRELYGS